MVGRRGAQHTFPVITHQKVPISDEKQGALSLSGTTVSLNTQASISPSVLSHFPYSVLIQHRHFEWVIITVAVSKWHVNTLRILTHEYNKLSSTKGRNTIAEY